MANSKGNKRACVNPKCNHNTGDHQSKTVVIKGKIVKSWRGNCNFNFCECQKYIPSKE